jgi:hypothetical protein
VPNAHDDIVRDDLDAIRRESFSETGLFQVVVDLVECLGLIMAKDNRKHNFAICVQFLRLRRHRHSEK